MSLYGSLWVTLQGTVDPYVSVWVPMGLYGSLWVTLWGTEDP